jgi:hypothetical protein
MVMGEGTLTTEGEGAWERDTRVTELMVRVGDVVVDVWVWVVARPVAKVYV